ncbi:MAG: TIGR04283 family arsenosugar biosynthesis glycosyltransferase [Gemmatimonadota bacterium]|nr:TIGR04283 family arsenosugar biosynthesis glycosyltransferase [Gemmatimonadota bacterium]
MPILGVVIPTLNESRCLPGLLSDLAALALPTDIVVADGGSSDDTVAVGRAHGARVVGASRGRAPQMNAGAAEVRGEWLCFLHADVRMPERARRVLAAALGAECDAAVWRLTIDHPGGWARIMEWGAQLRDRLGGLPYGDQGLLVRRALFEAVGGFPLVPIMEDVALVRAVRAQASLTRLEAPLLVSPRRWLRQGPYRTWLRNTALLTAYAAGVSPERMARWYPAEGT